MKTKILFMFCLSVFCACQISQQAQSTENINEVNSNQPTFTKEYQTNLINSKDLKPVDDSRFSSVKIDRTDLKDMYSLRMDIEYPQLKNPKTLQENKFNQCVKKQVDEQIADFNNFLVEVKQKEIKVKSRQEYYINLNYRVSYYSDSFTSIVMNWRGYSGYLNLDYFPSTINFDLKKGIEVELKDIFEPNSRYLDKVAEESKKILRRTCLSCGCGNGINAGDALPDNMLEEAETRNQTATNANSQIHYQDSMFFEKGTEPTEENYNGWSIIFEGLEITFGEYQVGPGCIGIIHIVIPFDNLKPILSKDLNFNREK